MNVAPTSGGLLRPGTQLSHADTMKKAQSSLARGGKNNLMRIDEANDYKSTDNYEDLVQIVRAGLAMDTSMALNRWNQNEN